MRGFAGLVMALLCWAGSYNPDCFLIAGFFGPGNYGSGVFQSVQADEESPFTYTLDFSKAQNSFYISLF